MILFLSQIQTAEVSSASAVDFTWLFIKMLLVLGIVSVAAVLILKYAVPRAGLMKKFQQGKFFRVISRYTIEPNRSLYLVSAGKKYLVIGVSDRGINLLREVPEDEVNLNHEN